MTLKEKIQTDFVQAFKAKDEITKSALSSLKAKITEAEKLKKNVDLSDDETIKIISSAIKQRKQSIEEFNKGNRSDLAEKEKKEMDVLQSYMPAQMTKEEIVVAVSEIMKGFSEISNRQALVGRTLGAFNKAYNGKAEVSLVKEVIESII